MDSTDIKDKIVIDSTESPEIAELFSTKQPGDKVTGRFEGTLDEAGTKVISISISKVEIEKDDEEDPGEAGESPEAEAAEGDSPSVAMYKSKGVPAQEDNLPPGSPSK